MAPPLTLTLDMSGCSSFSHDSTTEAKASLISVRSMSSIDRPDFSRAFWVDGIGPVSMVTGSTPARAKVWKRARGVRPRALAFSSLMISTAEAPSAICDELPAVTFPAGLDAGFRVASVSTGGAGGDLAVGLERWLQVGQRLDGGAGPDALVDGVHLVGGDELTGLLVARLGLHGDDLVVEAALGGGPLGALLALGAEGIELVAGD